MREAMANRRLMVAGPGSLSPMSSGGRLVGWRTKRLGKQTYVCSML